VQYQGELQRMHADKVELAKENMALKGKIAVLQVPQKSPTKRKVPCE
jgi:hypothetical protein